jgi:hypothetical protein
LFPAAVVIWPAVAVVQQGCLAAHTSCNTDFVAERDHAAYLEAAHSRTKLLPSLTFLHLSAQSEQKADSPQRKNQGKSDESHQTSSIMMMIHYVHHGFTKILNMIIWRKF